MNENINCTVLENFEKSEAINPIFKYIAYFCIIDLLIMPYFGLIVMPYSFPIILIAFLFLMHKRIKINNFDLISFLIISITATISVFIGILFGKSFNFIFMDFKRLIQFLGTFVYFFYFYAIAKYLDIRTIKRILLIGVIFYILIGILFVIDPMLLINLKKTVYSTGAYMIGIRTIEESMRYSYLFSDPNTAGYFILILVTFIFLNFRNNIILSLFLISSSFFGTIITKSRGATVSLIFLSILIIFSIFFKKNTKNRLRIKYFLLIVGIIFIGLFIYNYNAPFHDIVDDLINRIYESKSHLYTRLNKYSIVNEENIPFLLGKGFTIFNKGSIFSPHSDHIYIVYAYGIIAYIFTIMFLFRKVLQKEYFFILPGLVAFSVNTLVGEQKVFALFMIFLAICRNKNYFNYKIK